MRSPLSSNKPINRLSGNLFDRLPFVVAAAGARLMRLLHFMAMRALRKRGLRKVIVCPAGAGAALGMASLWIRHCTAPYLEAGHPAAFTISLRCIPAPVRKLSPVSSFITALPVVSPFGPIACALVLYTLYYCTVLFSRPHTKPQKRDRHHDKSIVS